MGQYSKLVRIELLKNQAVIADKCYVAERFLDRLRGLIGKRQFDFGDGMLFPRCSSVHMWFMKIPIDVLFIRKVQEIGEKKFFTVCSVREHILPWHIFPLTDFCATETLELPVGSIKKHTIESGDEICIASK